MRSAMMAMAAAGVLASTPSMAQTYSVIWNFSHKSAPFTDLHRDPTTGALYGTTSAGGGGNGAVFSLKEKRQVWRSNTLYAFGGGSDGSTPVSGLIEDSAGNLYGTTYGGGTAGDGTVFELSRSRSSWKETVLHDFSGGSDGANPQADLIMDKNTGVIYGTTRNGGAYYCGTAFEMTQSGGTWSEEIIHPFEGGNNGCNPEARLREQSRGHFYGVTLGGGVSNRGIAFALVKGNHWREFPIHSFTGGNDGGAPTDLDLDPNTETLYGTAITGGITNNGVVFQLTKTTGGWTETTLYNFNGESDGRGPVGLHLDLTSDTLYGTTGYGGSYESGTVFQLANSGGNWTYKQLHSFGSSDGDGVTPYVRPIVDPDTGYLYGTTEYGGPVGGGTAWMIIP